MENLKISRVKSNEIMFLLSISRETFFETFSRQNSAHDMQKYLEEELSIEKLSKELQDPDSEFYFARTDDDVIGYLKVNYGKAQTELKDQRSVEVERIYVRKEFQGQNIGQLLYDKALVVAKKRKADFIWLGVWEKNQRAIAFYAKNGFIEFDKHPFKLGDDEQTDIMMRLNLEK